MKKIIIFLSTICIMLIFAIHIDAHASQQFMTEDDARYFLNFVYNRNINNDDLKNDENYKMLTGTLEDGVDANAIKFNFLKVLQGQINNNIDKASYNCDILRSDLQGYLEKKAAGMKDLPEQEYNAFLNKQLKTLEDAFVDWLCSEAATRAGIYVTDNILDNIKLASSSYSKLVSAPQKAIAYADYVINEFRAALLVFDEECAGRYSYFSVYLSNRKAYSNDTIFETIMSYNKLAITQNYPLGTIDWYMGSKDSWIEHIDDIERWADITIQVENSIEGVNGTTSSGSTTTPTPENTTITFTKDTYITDTSDYMGYAWNLNGYTVVVDNDLSFSKNININNGALIITGNMTYSGTTLNIGTGFLIVEGNLTHNGYKSTIDVKTGNLKIDGDFYSIYGEFDIGSGNVEINGSFLSKGWNGNEYSTTTFKMQNDKAYMLVKGDFSIYSNSGSKYQQCNTGYITAGVLEVKGDFSAGGNVSGYTNYSFPATGTHKVILSGSEQQEIYFSSTSSYFNILVNKNENTTLKTSYYKHLFNEIPYIVNFTTNTSKGTVTKILDSTKEISTTKQINSLGTISKNGYYFKGWYLDEAYTIPLTTENDIIKSDMTLYAKWTEPMLFNDVQYSSENNAIYVNVSLDEELESQNGIVIIAIYDGRKLITTHYANAEKTVSHTFKNVPITENGYTVKVFCWSDFETLIPLCNSINQQIQ